MTDRDGKAAPERRFGYSPGDEPIPKTDETNAVPIPGEEMAQDNRGHRAGVTANGEVVGSGAGAGGKGGPEDFDSDAQAGGGTYMVKHTARPNNGGDGSKHGSA